MKYFYLLKIQYFVNYADNITQFSCEKTFDQVINYLKTDLHTFKVWFYQNFLGVFAIQTNAIL